MNKLTLVLLMMFTLLMTACGSSPSSTARPDSASQTNPAAGELSTSMQVAIGTIKLDGTDNAVTIEQAKELLPLWQTLEVLYSSDTAASQEIDALVAQIEDTMTAEQTQAITALGLTRQDMMSVMQSQGLATSSTQTTQSAGGSNNNGGFGPRGFTGGPPADGGGFPGGGPGFENRGTRQQSTGSSDGTTQQSAFNPNRIPTPLVRAVIEYLKEKADAS